MDTMNGKVLVPCQQDNIHRYTVSTVLGYSIPWLRETCIGADPPACTHKHIEFLTVHVLVISYKY